jgi:hydrogenase expression/formation protein HypE
MNLSGMGKRTAALDSNLEIVRKTRELKTRWTLDSNLAAGDKIILTGAIGDHGIAVLSAQQGLKFGSDIRSDVKPLNKMVQKLLGEVGGVVAMKDPTRGGLADALNEWTEKSHVGILTYEHNPHPEIRQHLKCSTNPLEIVTKKTHLARSRQSNEVLAFLRQTHR